jgi:predicted Zn finger-like uncharacterized protein
MKIICPSCQANYEVADQALGANGRNMRCAACGHYWFQKPPSHEDAITDENKNTIRVEKETRTKKNPKANPKTKARANSKSKALPIHQEMRKRANEKVRLTHIGAIAIGWIFALALFGLMIFSMIQNRLNIVHKWPKSASFFAMLGAPINLYGLEIKNVEIRVGNDEQGPRLIVLGNVNNVSNEPKALPYLRVTLVTKTNKKIASWLVDPSAALIDKQQTISFQSIRRNPPNGQLKAIITFAEAPKTLKAVDVAQAPIHNTPEVSENAGDATNKIGADTHGAAPETNHMARENALLLGESHPDVATPQAHEAPAAIVAPHNENHAPAPTTHSTH